MITLSGHNGTINGWEYSTDNGATWTAVSNTTATQSYTNLTATTWYRALVQSGACNELASDTAIITVYQAVTPALAGSDRVLCLQDTVHLAANTPTSGNGTWSQISGPSTLAFSNIQHPTSNITNLVPGIYSLVWTVSNGICADSRDTVVIELSSLTVPGTLAGNDTVCAGMNGGVITLSGHNGTINGWEYSTDNGATWTAIANTTTTNNYSNLTTTTWYRALVQSGACNELASDTAIITVYQAVTPALAGGDRVLCLQDTVHLAANTPTSGNGSWSQISGPSTVAFTDATNPQSTIANLQSGIYSFAWTISNGICADSRDTVVIELSSLTVPGTLAGNNTVCAGMNGGAITLSGHNGTINGWEYSTDNGSTWTAINNTTATNNYTNLTTTTWYRALVQSGACNELASDTAIITVYQAVTPALAGSDRVLCLQDTVVLNGNTPTSGNGTWSQLSGPSTVSFSSIQHPTSNITNLVPGIYSLVWTVSNGICADSRDTVVIELSSLTVPGTLAGNDTVCAGMNGGVITLSGHNGSINGWEYSTDNGATWTAISNTTTTNNYNNLTTTTWYRALVQSGACNEMASDTAIITVYQAVTPALAGDDRILCLQDTVVLAANTPTSGNGTWSQLSGPSTVSFSSIQHPTSNITNLVPGIYSLVWTVSNGICADSRDTVVIELSSLTVPGTLAGNDTVCAGMNGGVITLSGHNGSINGWEYSTDNGATWTAISNTTTTNNYNNLTTTTWYRALVQSGSCNELASDTAIITVYQAVTPALAGDDRVLCLQDTVVLAANTPTSGNGTWSQVSGPSTVVFAAVSSELSAISNLQPGVYSFEWTISNGICADSRDTVVIELNSLTVPGTLAGNDTVCAGMNGGVITLSGHNGTINGWEYSTDNGATWTATSNTTTTNNYSNLTTTTWYRALVQSGSCNELASDTAIITVYQAVTPALAGSDRVLCLTDTVHLAANTPTSGNVAWLQLSGPSTVSFSSIQDPASSISGLTPGIYSFAWTISNGICADSRDTVVIELSSLTVPGTLAGNDTVCAGMNGGVITLSGYNGTINGWEYSIDNGATWTPVSNTTATQSYTNLTATTWYRALVQSGACNERASDTAIITVYQAVTPALAGGDRVLCLQDTVVLAANTPTSGNGTWSQISGPSTVSFSSIQDPASSITVLVPGTYSFAWTISNGICADSRDTVVIELSSLTVPGTLAGNDTVCAGMNGGVITLSGHNGTINGWDYSTDNGATWTAVSNTTATQSYTNLTATTWYRALVQSGACNERASDTAIITVYQAVTPALAGDDRVLCLQDTLHLAANTPTSGNGTWSQLSGPSTVSFTDATNPQSAIANLQSGAYSFAWTISNGICADSRDTVVIELSSLTVPGTLAGNDTVCAGMNGGVITLSGHNGTVNGWEYSTDNGATWTAIANTTTTNNYTNLTATTWYRALVQSGACAELASDTAIITVYQAVTPALAGDDRILCLQDTVVLAANTPTSGNGTWSQISGPSTVSFSSIQHPTSNITNLVPGIYSLVWTVTNGICADSRDTVVIELSSLTVPGTLAGNDTVCAGMNGGVIILNGHNGTINGWEYSNDNGTTWTAIANTSITNNYSNLTTTTWYRALVQSGACNELASDTAIITVYQAVTPALAGDDRVLCLQDRVVLAANTPTSGAGTWSQLSGPSTVSFSSIQNPASSISGLTPGTYSFVWAVSNGICADSRDTVVIELSSLTVPGTLAGNDTVCAGINSGVITLSGHNGTINGWEYSTDNGATWTAIANTTTTNNYTNLTTTTWYRALVQSGACNELASDTAIITVYQAVTPALAGDDRVLCLQDTVVLAANTPTSGNGTWSQVSGPSTVSFSSIQDPASSITALVPGIYSFAWTISNGICADSRDTVVITIGEPVINVIDTTSITVCAGTPVTIQSLQLVANNGNNVIRWEMSVDSINWTTITGATSATYTFIPDTSMFIRRWIQSGPCEAMSDVAHITVQAVISNNIIASNQAHCLGDTADTITGTVPVGGNNHYNYTWQQSTDGGATWINIANSNSVDFAPGLLSQTTMFRRLVISGACNEVTSNEVTIVMNGPAFAEFTVLQSTGCSPFNIDSTVIQPTINSTVNGSYNWYANGQFIGSGSTFPGYTLSHPADSVIISLITLSNSGCASDTAIHTLYVVPLPQPAFTVSDTMACGPVTVQFTNQTPNAGNYQHLWNFGNGQTSSVAQPAAVVYQPSATTTDTVYTATLTVFNHCDTITVSQEIVVRSKPVISFTATPVSGCAPLAVTFNASVVGTNSNYSVVFGDGSDTTITGSGSFTHVYTATATTQVLPMLIASNECGADTIAIPVQLLAADTRLQFSISDTAACAPHTVTIVKKSTGAASYTWNLGDGTVMTTSATDTIRHTFTQPGVYAIQLTGAHQCGDSVLTKYVYVHQVPAASFTAASAACIGDSIYFTNTSANANQYQWNFGDGNSSAAANPAYAYSAAGNFTATLIAMHQYSTGVTCSDTTTAAIAITDHLPGQMTVSDTAGMCLPFAVTFVNTTGVGGTTTWNFGDGNTATGDSVVHAYTAFGTYNVLMTNIAPGGCRYTDTATVNITYPAGALQYAGGNYCGETTIQFNSTVGAGQTFTWNFGDGTTATTTNPSISHTYGSGIFLPFVTITSANGCTVTIPGTEEIRVDVVNAGFTYTSANSCGSTTLTFSDTSSSFSGITSWNWNFGGGSSVSNQQHPTVVFTTSGTYNVTLYVTSAAGCTDSITIPVQVDVHQVPVASIAAANSICVQSNMQFNGSFTSADSVVMVRWDLGNGQQSNALQVNTTYTTSGTFPVSLVVGTEYGCYDTATVNVQVNPLPVVTTSGNQQVCMGQPAVLQAYGASNYSWSSQGQTICTDCPQVTVTPMYNTQYIVTGTSAFGCTANDTVDVTVIAPTRVLVPRSDTICIGETTQLRASGAYSYSWFPSTGLNRTDVANPVASPQSTTTYNVIGTDRYGCFSDTSRITVVVGDKPQVFIGADTTVLSGSAVQLNAVVGNGPAINYTWRGLNDLSCVNCPTPIAVVKTDQCISCTVTNIYGCVATDTICITTFCKSAQVFIPNAFSPDGDGVNDKLVVMGQNIKLVKSFRIFNRWGQLVFEKVNFNVNDPAYGWDGTVRGVKAAPDVYVYMCEVICENNTPYTYKGNVGILN
ncbi:PKD domain-containing protein [Aridibaculum aurantiacum]|uniref:PKD domain-containing protein n=1 Tax=Aridibaculum aurantiacum TaxID=2810307 RepID=UPI001A95EEAA|nr:PKD domain-containing protein [Aridibaculum aurantiacum]